MPRQKIRGSPARNCAQLWLRASGCIKASRRALLANCITTPRTPPGSRSDIRGASHFQFSFLSPFFLSFFPSFLRISRRSISRGLFRGTPRAEKGRGIYRGKLQITSAHRINFINYTCDRCNYKRHLLSRIILQRLWAVFN